MRIAKVALAFFSIGFLAGSFERAAGLGDPERAGRIKDRQVDATVARGTRIVVASVGALGGFLPHDLRPRATEPSVQAIAPETGPELDLATVPDLNPDLYRHAFGTKRALSWPGAVGLSTAPAPKWISLAPAEAPAAGGRPGEAIESGRARDLPSQEFIMPFERGRVTSLFNQGRYHPAIDLAGPLGSTVHSTTRKQRVTFAGWQRGYGNVVVTRDDLGRSHLYGHLLRIVAKVGNILDQGQRLGALGSTGRSTGPHVHYEVRARSGAHINPVSLLFPGRRVGRGFAWNGSRSIRPGSTTVAQAQPRPR
jgi:murein DD-endopeptidase MepM/ murein hydrolase activator NlpD